MLRIEGGGLFVLFFPLLRQRVFERRQRVSVSLSSLGLQTLQRMYLHCDSHVCREETSDSHSSSVEGTEDVCGLQQSTTLPLPVRWSGERRVVFESRYCSWP
jgi:hypothetical protein